MFFDRFKFLCNVESTTPNGVGKILNISSGSITAWKKNKITPKTSTIQKIAAFFKVPQSFLLEEKPFTQWDKLKENKDNVLGALSSWINNEEYTQKVLNNINNDIDFINIVDTWIADITFTNNGEIHMNPRISQEAIQENADKLIPVIPEKVQKNKPVTEGDRLREENNELFDQLPTNKKQEALNYLRFLVEHQDQGKE
ncbi:hypothetical protein [Caproiciproducens sp.]